MFWSIYIAFGWCTAKAGAVYAVLGKALSITAHPKQAAIALSNFIEYRITYNVTFNLLFILKVDPYFMYQEIVTR